MKNRMFSLLCVILVLLLAFPAYADTALDSALIEKCKTPQGFADLYNDSSIEPLVEDALSGMSKINEATLSSIKEDLTHSFTFSAIFNGMPTYTNLTDLGFYLVFDAKDTNSEASQMELVITANSNIVSETTAEIIRYVSTIYALSLGVETTECSSIDKWISDLTAGSTASIYECDTFSANCISEDGFIIVAFTRR